MKFLRVSVCTLFFLIAAHSWAGRILPNDIQIAVLKNAVGKEVVLGSAKRGWLRTVTLGVVNGNKSFLLSNNIRVRNDRNNFETYNKLQNYRNRTVAVRFDRSERIQDIWVLTAEERDRLLRSNQ